MSLSDVIDRRYRLLPADLAGRPRQVIVRGVTLEGVETVTPLIHFEGVGRPLALDADQRIEMARIARSTILSDWIGAAVVLNPVRDRAGERIHLRGLEDAWLPAARPLAHLSRWQGAASRRNPLWSLLAIMAIVAVALAIAWLVENTENLNTLLDVFN